MEFRQHVVELNAQLSDLSLYPSTGTCAEKSLRAVTLFAHGLGQFLYRLGFGIGFTERSHLRGERGGGAA